MGWASSDFEDLAVGLEGHTAGSIDAQVGPEVMDGVELIVLDDSAEHHDHPGGNAGQGSDVPLRGLLGDALYALVPVGDLGDLEAGFVHALHEFGHVTDVDAADLALLPAVFFD